MRSCRLRECHENSLKQTVLGGKHIWRLLSASEAIEHSCWDAVVSWSITSRILARYRLGAGTTMFLRGSRDLCTARTGLCIGNKSRRRSPGRRYLATGLCSVRLVLRPDAKAARRCLEWDLLKTLYIHCASKRCGMESEYSSRLAQRSVASDFPLT